MGYPFLYVNHGPLAPDCVGKCEELFMWFARPVTREERKRIEAITPAPLSCYWHWDAEFCYLGSEGDSYDAVIRFDYAPEPLRKRFAELDAQKDGKRWFAVFQEFDKHFAASVEIFSREVEQFANKVHEIAPLLVFWGPHQGQSEGDPWHEHSCERFADVMFDRLNSYKPIEKGGAKYLDWVRSMCSPLLVKKASRKKGASRDDERSIKVLDEQARKAMPRGVMVFCSYEEGELLEIAGLVGELIGEGKGARKQLERLAPLTQLTYLMSYEAQDARWTSWYDDPVARLRELALAVKPDEKKAVVPLLSHLAAAIAHDSPAFDRSSKKRAPQAYAVMQVGLELGEPRPSAFARAARYRRWAGDAKGALTMLQEALARSGEHKVLLKGAAKAARAAGDAEAERDLLARLARRATEPLAPRGLARALPERFLAARSLRAWPSRPRQRYDQHDVIGARQRARAPLS